jgi:hypothetical protein
MCPRVLKIITSPTRAIIISQMFHDGLVFHIPFNAVNSIDSFGEDQNFLSIFCSNIGSYVNLHLNAHALFETPYGVAPIILNTFKELNKKAENSDA